MQNFLSVTNTEGALDFNQSILSQLTKICEPLFSNFGLTVFSYSHFFDDGTCLDICTHKEWYGHYLTYFAHSSFVKNYVQNIYQSNTRYALWDNRPDPAREKVFSQFITDSCELDIWHGFSIYGRHQKSLEAWHFATKKKNHEIINFYINKLDLLAHFILYFKDRARKIIDHSEQEKLIVFQDKPTLDSAAALGEEGSDVDKFMDQTTVNTFSLETQMGPVVISKREAECVYHLSGNKTIKEIARSMELSPRTVESYLENVKRKTHCFNRSELVNLFSKSCIQHL